MKRVYFMRRVDGVGPIKIGCADEPEKRLVVHQNWAPERLEIVTSAPGDFRDEKRVHRQFDQHRLHGEWFEAAPAVLAMVAKVAATGKLPPAPILDRNQLIADMYRNGATMQQIGDKFGFSRQRVEQILRRDNVERLGCRPEVVRTSIAAKNEAKVCGFAEQGLSVPQIALAIGDSRQNVRMTLLRNGLKAQRSQRKRDPETMKRASGIAAAYLAREKTADIGAAYGIPQPSVYAFLRIAGVEPGRNRRKGHTHPRPTPTEAAA